MALGIRKYIARKISELDEPEVFPLQRWMRLPSVKEEIIDEIQKGIVDKPAVDMFFSDVSLHYTGKFYVDKSRDDYDLILFPKIKSGPIFFLLKRVKSSPIFFTIKRATNRSPKEFSTLYIEGTYSPEIVKFAVDTDIINLLDWGVKIYSEECVLTIPDSVDLLAEFVPTVQNFDLLDEGSLAFEESKVIYDPAAKFDLPKAEVVYGEYSEIDISTFGPMFYYQEFSFKEGKSIHIKDTVLNTSELTSQKLDNIHVDFVDSGPSASSDLIENRLEAHSLFKSLEPVYELTQALKSDILDPLLSYQQEGAEFLFNSERAFFYDDFELGKEYQCLFALKMLLRIRAVKKVLIVTSNYKELVRDSRHKDLPLGIWESGIDTLLTNFPRTHFTSANNISSVDVFENVLNIISYQALEDCFEYSKLTPEFFNAFSCIIFDDISEEILKLKTFNNFKSDLSCKYIWFVSDFDNPSNIEKVAGLFQDKELRTLARQKKSVPQIPERLYIDFILDLDPDNSSVPKDLIYDTKSKIQLLVESGDIMRIQPSIFQLVHETQRKTNFNMNDPEFGNKTKLLKYNVERILNRYDRLLIYSQFDDSGIQQVSEFLSANGIEFIKFDLADSAKNISDKLAHAKSYEGKLVYLTNLKQKGLFFKFPNVSHLINFDNWWNPSSRYSIEDNMNPGDDRTITVYNYFLKDTFEYDLIEKLYELGLRDRNVTSCLSIDNFYNIVDESIWCDIIGIPSTERIEEEKEKFSINSLRELVNYSELFLSKLNFTSIDSQIEILNYSYTITAKFNNAGEIGKVLVKCVYAQNLSHIYIREVIKDHVGEGDNSKVFLITSGTIENPMTVLPHNLTLIDGEMLKTYLRVL